MKKLEGKNIFHPIFFLLFVWFSVSGFFVEFFVFFLVLIIHESGHFFVAKKLGYKLNSFYLAPFGMALNYNQNNISNKDEIKISLAGPLVNLASAMIILAFWWVHPPIYFFTESFVFQSLFLAFFNLLPAYPLDGGRVVTAYFSKKYSRKNVLKFCLILNFFFAGIFFLLFAFSCLFNCNTSLILPCIFLLSGSFNIKNEIKYEPLYISKKTTKNFDNIQIIYIKSQLSISQILRKIESKKYTLFYVDFEGEKTKIISEKKLIELSLVFPLSAKLTDVFSVRNSV